MESWKVGQDRGVEGIVVVEFSESFARETRCRSEDAGDEDELKGSVVLSMKKECNQCKVCEKASRKWYYKGWPSRSFQMVNVSRREEELERSRCALTEGEEDLTKNRRWLRAPMTPSC